MKNKQLSNRAFRIYPGILRILLLAVLLVAFQYGYSQLPALRLKTIYGKTVNTSDMGKTGKPVIISFFATYCKPCLRELQAINELYDDWQSETGVEIFVVSIDDAQNSAKVKTLVEGYDWRYTVLLDPNGELKRALGVNMIPAVIVLNTEGKIIHTKTGYTDGSENELFAKIKTAQKSTEK